VMFLVQMGPVAHETCIETIQLLGQEVLPHFRKVPVASSQRQNPQGF
jgi:hypothetical protein